MMRLAVLTSHPIQYQAPLFRALARRMDLTVYFAHRATRVDQAEAGFGVGFEWDVDLLTGYEHHFLTNVARNPCLDHFFGCDTPDVARRLRDGRFDVFLAMGWHLKCFWQAIWAAKRSAIPVMVRGDSQLETPRGELKRAVKALTYPFALRVFDAALYVGEHSRRYWEHYSYPANRLIFSPHCVDNEWFAARATAAARNELRGAYGISSETKVALFAGKLLSFKRPLDLISAARILKSQGFDLTILVAGAGPLGEELTASARSAGVRLIQLGFCNQTEMPAAFAAADVLVLPSGGEETWGLVANEALASGAPIIVSDVCGCAPDLAGDGRAGRIFPVGDIQKLATALRGVMQHPPSHQAIASKIATYSVEAAANGVEAAIDSIAGNAGAGR